MIKDRAVDIAVARHVLEQLPSDAERVLKEMARVSKYTVLMEPVWEFQTVYSKSHLKRSGYVMLTMNMLESIGKIIQIKEMDLNDHFNRSVLVVIENK